MFVGLQALGHLQVLRADLGEEGSFDEAVAGCHYAFLVAAPVNLASENPEVRTDNIYRCAGVTCLSSSRRDLVTRGTQKELIGPAVRGTLNVLRSCAKAGTVKRVILTSSAATVVPSGSGSPRGDGGGRVLDEETWPDVDYLVANKPLTWVHALLHT